MYVALLIGLMGTGLWLVLDGTRRSRPGRRAAGIALALGAVLFFALLEFWGEMLWFDALGYSRRFWTIVWAKVALAAAGAVVGAGGLTVLTAGIHWKDRWTRAVITLAAAVAGTLWGLSSWDEALLFLNRVPTGTADPVLGRDTGFYLFSLPLYDRLFLLIAGIVVAGALLTGVSTFVRIVRGNTQLRLPTPGEEVSIAGLLRSTAAFAVVFALGNVLALWHLMYSDWGVVAGPGWTDVHIRMPAYQAVAGVTLLLAGWAFVSVVRTTRRMGAAAALRPGLRSLGRAWTGFGAVWLLGWVVIPGAVQWLAVEPNEITFEKPYIANNIAFTRHGFRLHDVEVRQFPASEVLSEELVRQNEHLLSEVRLWDYRALAAVYRQFQEIRLYYAFHDVDLDRYQIGDRYRQVMVSARELKSSNLPAQSQTFVNRRFKYTHGYGVTLATVSDFTSEGLPDLLVKDIPPRAAVPELEVAQPQIYYGELTRGPVYVNSTEEEFDHPSGDENAYCHYAGQGGVLLLNLWRKFVFGWKFDGTRFLLSSYPRADTRILFHRRVRERVSTLAPFLEFDDDPYVTLVDGKLYWIVDGYTTSSYYPYSEPFASREVIEYGEGRLAGPVDGYLEDINYVRNSVKAVVDAFEGTVTFYVFEPEDPLVQAWSRAFPELFQDEERMPEGLRAHVRYPVDLLLTQGLVYAKYHMQDPEVFYNQEDLWVRATEKYYANVQPVEPYYVMWELPDSDRAEFVLILPFTPKNRQVLIGWIAGLCDGENYGRFLAYKFPKERRVLGPQQVETKIDQDRFLSGQLTLWDQRGSSVIRGNVLAFPIEDMLLYVEPIYLQAETAAYPELRLVAVMHGDRMSYAETFEKALEGLFAETPGIAREPLGELEGSLHEVAVRANAAFERYLELTAQQRFSEAGEELAKLQGLLQRMVQDAEPAADGR